VRFILPALVLVGLGWYGWHRWRLWHAPYEWSGTVEARTISLGSRAGGRVAKVLVKEGDRVKAGDSLVVLEPGDWSAQLAQAQAQLAIAEATLDKFKAGARPEEIAAARARSETAQAVLQETTAGARSEEVAAAESRLQAQAVALARAQKDAERLHKLAASTTPTSRSPRRRRSATRWPTSSTSSATGRGASRWRRPWRGPPSSARPRSWWCRAAGSRTSGSPRRRSRARRARSIRSGR
jgi:multidrug efflux pump subunit AcrA (membrane-fusion protein)